MHKKCSSGGTWKVDRPGEEENFSFYIYNRRLYLLCHRLRKTARSGYKIKVKEFTQDQSHIYIDTTLIGVTKEHQRKGISYPYIILKSQFYEKDVIFH